MILGRSATGHEHGQDAIKLVSYLDSSAPDFMWALVKVSPDFTTAQYSLAIHRLIINKAVVDYDHFGTNQKLFYLFEVDLNRHDIRR